MFESKKKEEKPLETPIESKLLKMGITLEDGEEVSIETFEELSNGKGSDENE